jgi:hypothetical protein
MRSPREDGWSGVDTDGDGIDMYPAPAGKLMADLGKILTDAQQIWGRVEGEITALEGKLGDGPLGKAAMEQYSPAAQQLRKIIDDMLESFGKLSDAGTKAVPTYVNSDHRAGQNFGF